MMTVVCIVTHEDGHEERTQMSGLPDQSGKKNPIQQIASTVSYLRRYTLTGALGITVSDEDDDGVSSGDQEQASFYPKQQFDSNFPNWQKQIQNGNKTPGQIITFLRKKGAQLSDEQIQQINNAGK